MEKRVLLRDLKLTDINPQIFGVKSYNSNEKYPMHRIRRHVLHYVTNGRGTYLCNGQEHPVSMGDIFVCHPGYLVSYVPDAADPFSYIWVSFDCTAAFSGLLNRNVFSAVWAQNIFERLLQAGETSSPEWGICACLYAFFAELAQLSPSVVPQPDDYVSRAVSFIQTNYPDPIRISDIAADLGLSRNYFCRIFHEKTGMSPQQYLVSCRMTAAVGLLTDQGLSQKETALQVGYPDVCAFSRMFKRVFGEAPGAYVLRWKKR